MGEAPEGSAGRVRAAGAGLCQAKGCVASPALSACCSALEHLWSQPCCVSEVLERFQLPFSQGFLCQLGAEAGWGEERGLLQA